MAEQITWENKVQGRNLPLVPVTEKLTFGEVNDLKTKFNQNAVELGQATTGLAGKLPIGGGNLGIQAFRPIWEVNPLNDTLVTIIASKDLATYAANIKNICIEVDSSAGAITITVNLPANQATTDNFELEFLPIDLTNDVTFVAGAGITLNSIDGYLKLDKAFGGTILKYRGGNNFVLIGNLKA